MCKTRVAESVVAGTFFESLSQLQDGHEAPRAALARAGEYVSYLCDPCSAHRWALASVSEFCLAAQSVPGFRWTLPWRLCAHTRESSTYQYNDRWVWPPPPLNLIEI